VVCQNDLSASVTDVSCHPLGPLAQWRRHANAKTTSFRVAHFLTECSSVRGHWTRIASVYFNILIMVVHCVAILFIALSLKMGSNFIHLFASDITVIFSKHRSHSICEIFSIFFACRMAECKIERSYSSAADNSSVLVLLLIYRVAPKSISHYQTIKKCVKSY